MQECKKMEGKLLMENSTPRHRLFEIFFKTIDFLS